MNGFQKRTQSKMEKLEQTAIQMLSKPIQDITVTDLARQAGVSQVTLYNYYGSKEALLRAALKRLLDEQTEVFVRLGHSDLPFDDKLKQMILLKKQSSQLVNRDTQMQLLQGDAEFTAYVVKLSQEQAIPLFLQLIADGRRCGRVRHSVRDESLLVYMGLFTRLLTSLSEADYRQLDLPGIAEDIMDMFLNGILNGDGQERV